MYELASEIFAFKFSETKDFKSIIPFPTVLNACVIALAESIAPYLPAKFEGS